MKVLARELSFFFLFATASIWLTPTSVNFLGLTSEAFIVNKVEKIFLMQIGQLAFMANLVVLYLLRFVFTLVRRKLMGSSGPQP
ncbi:MAG: hypothetical protein FJX89_06670 [Bacteroidetes bacterium]|nr:hypothetical protein [Bacteroidota bacterium]